MPSKKKYRHRAGKQERARRERRRLAREADNLAASIQDSTPVITLPTEPPVPCSSLDLFWGRWDAPYEGDSPGSDIPPFPYVEQVSSAILNQTETYIVADYDPSREYLFQRPCSYEWECSYSPVVHPQLSLAHVEVECNNNVVSDKAAISVANPEVIDLTDDWDPWTLDFTDHPDQNALPAEYQPFVEPESHQPYDTCQPQDIPWILHKVEFQATLGPLIDPTRAHPADPRVPVLLRRRELMLSILG